MGYKRFALYISYVLFSAVLLGSLATAYATDEPASTQKKEKIDWADGPLVARLGDIAEIKIPAGYRFTGKEGTKKFLELTQNPPSGSELGTIIPILSNQDDSKENEMWFVLFEFSDVGYVKDDDKDKLDADQLLKSITESTEEANKERANRGWPPYHVNGWYKPPYYDTATKNLTWAIQGYSADGKNNEDHSVNYSVRILGRRGTMNADLVLSPAIADKATPQFGNLLAGFSFLPGGRYSEFRPGDKVAEYGLATLVAGGATAVALKTGLFAKFWKLIVVAFTALLALIKRGWNALKRKFRGEPAEETPQQG